MEKATSKPFVEPDLQLILRDRAEPSGICLDFETSAPNPSLGLDFQVFANKDLPPGEIFEKHSKDLAFLEEVKGQQSTAEDMKILLRNYGHWMYRDWLPDPLKDKLEAIAGDFRHLRILEANPWVPWELMTFAEKVEGESVWGYRYGLARWIHGCKPRHPQTIRSIAVVGPPSKDGFPEFQAFTGSTQVESIPFTVQGVQEALASGQFDLFHFQGLSNLSRETLDLCVDHPLQETTTDPQNENPIIFSAHHLPTLAPHDTGTGPLVTFGGVPSQHLVTGLARTHGWAKAFLEGGASAFVGCYWEVQPQASRDFFSAFFENLLLRMPLGMAAMDARTQCREEHPIDSLGFTLFAHPMAHCGPTAYLPPAYQRLTRRKPKPKDRAERNEPATTPTHSTAEITDIEAEGDIRFGKISHGPNQASHQTTKVKNVTGGGDITFESIEHH